MSEILQNWISEHYDIDEAVFIKALEQSPSAQGYIHGAVSEILLVEYLKSKNFIVHRIKEKPAGGYDEKKIGYKGDFLVRKADSDKYFVIECKGLKTNSEFRSAETDSGHLKNLSKEQAFNVLKKFFQIDKNSIYEKGYKKYLKAKEDWESKNPNKTFPSFKWSKNNPGPDNADITSYFSSLEELKNFVENSNPELLTENAFREKMGLYKILQTHEPSDRIDPETNKKQAAPLVSDFSIMAVDLFQRYGEHKFVFMNPDKIAHSPTSPNHIYQNYIIDILIPTKKDELDIRHPWYLDIDECINKTNPRMVDYDETQIDFR